MIHASEGGHFYDRQGKPVYEVPRADGKGTRPATLADARKLNLVPGVSGIISCAAKPGLIRWQQEQVLHAALTLPVIHGESEKSYLARILSDAHEQARKAAERGTAIHAAIQGYYEGNRFSGEFEPYVEAAVGAIVKRYGEHPWIAEQSFASPLGYGGKIDLHCDTVLLDFKTKEFEEPINLWWPEQCMQLAAYRKGLALGRPITIANVFVSTKKPGLVHIHEWKDEDRLLAWDKFYHLLKYWQADRRYDSSFQELVPA